LGSGQAIIILKIKMQNAKLDSCLRRNDNPIASGNKNAPVASNGAKQNWSRGTWGGFWVGASTFLTEKRKKYAYFSPVCKKMVSKVFSLIGVK